jgi:hypothetical protein
MYNMDYSIMLTVLTYISSLPISDGWNMNNDLIIFKINYDCKEWNIKLFLRLFLKNKFFYIKIL